MKKCKKVNKKNKIKYISLTAQYIILLSFAVFFIAPVFVVFMNSLKSKLYIIENPFAFPNSLTFIGLDNYIYGISNTSFFKSFFITLFITVASTALIILVSSMFSWYVYRVRNKITKVLYYVIIFSMIVPFQMVMYSVTYIAHELNFSNPIGIVFLYVGFGVGLSVFTYTGYLRNIPIEIEESALIDGCNPLKLFFLIIMPLLKPITITISVLNIMWIWNDYLLPYLVLGTGSYMTLPVAIQQSMKGLYGDVNWGSFMAMIILTIIPVIIFYFFTQKYMVKDATSGAVKG